MSFIVTENCIKCKIGDCVEVCPVDCFYEGPNMLVINPDECIECALCEPECPINAIYSEESLPSNQKKFININKKFSKKWKNVTEKCNTPKDSNIWINVKNKIKFLKS